MKRTAIVARTQPDGNPSATLAEWTRRRVAELINSATEWGLNTDSSLAWYTQRNVTAESFTESGRDLFKDCGDPGEDWLLISASRGLFARGNQQSGTIEFVQIHEILKNGFSAFPKSGDQWQTRQSEKPVTYAGVGLDKETPHLFFIK